jgi:hypothetical protein
MRLFFSPAGRNVWLPGMLAGALLAACGGGNSGAPAEGPLALSYPTGTVSVTVTDAFGEPVSSARVSVHKDGVSSPVRTTDSAGHVDIPRIPLGTVSVSASYEMSPGGPLRGGAEATVLENRSVDVALTLIPSPYDPFVGIGASTVEAPLNPDGQTVEVTLPVFLAHYDAEWEWTGLAFEACTPDRANDSASPLGDCVVGPAGFDADYAADNDGRPLAAPLASEPAPAALRYATLLLDQSAEMARRDPSDFRLYGARYAATRIGDEGRIAVAAFAADDPTGTELRTLERQPLTVYPVSSPRFLAPSATLTATIDALSEREGGVAPLYAALSEGIDFIAAKVPAGERRNLLLLTDGHDDTCGDAAACAGARQEVIDKTIASGVQLTSIATLMADEDPSDGPRNLAMLVEDTDGVALWVTDRTQLGAAFEMALISQNGWTARLARFRLVSTTPGAFASGHVVRGALTYAFCPWDCSWITVPVAIRIP